MFHQLVTAIRRTIGPKATLTVRSDETPPSATFHALMDGHEYVISVTPTRRATLNDAGEPDPPPARTIKDSPTRGRVSINDARDAARAAKDTEP